MATENLIALVYSKPEVWDQNSVSYSSKEKKLKAWQYISEKLNCTVETAKVRWTNLRDLFRRELKKAVRTAKMTGNPEACVPRWQHFKAMLFLKDQMLKNDYFDIPSFTFDESISKHYLQTVHDDDMNGEDGSYDEFCADLTNHAGMLPPSTSQKRNAESHSNGYDHADRVSKQQCFDPSSADSCESYPLSPNAYHETDEDYHFVMSILSSVRRIRPDRKTSFKMKVLQLIIDEENCSSA